MDGTDAESFLQGQLTQDVSRVTDEEPLPAAWCNPKGRVFVTMTVFRRGDSFILVVPASMAEGVVRRLTMYRLRANVSLSVSDDLPTVGLPADDPAALIRAAIPVIDDTNSESFTPHMLNLDKLGAISFSKGCYTGQEVVARTEHLGQSKRRLMRYEAADDGIAVGMKLSDGERDVGEVVNVAGRELLAVTPLALHDAALSCNGIAMTPVGLPYDL